jgi:hypothetical protein
VTSGGWTRDEERLASRLSLFFVGVFLVALLALLPGASCAETKALVADLSPAGSCLIDQLLTGQLADPVDDMLACAGATEQSIEAFIATLENPPLPDGGPILTQAGPLRDATVLNAYRARIAAAKVSLAARRVRRFGQVDAHSG